MPIYLPATGAFQGKEMKVHYTTICTIVYCSANSFLSWSHYFVVTWLIQSPDFQIVFYPIIKINRHSDSLASPASMVQCSMNSINYISGLNYVVTGLSNLRLSLRKVPQERSQKILPQVIQEGGDQNTSTSAFKDIELASRNFFLDPKIKNTQDRPFSIKCLSRDENYCRIIWGY